MRNEQADPTNMTDPIQSTRFSFRMRLSGASFNLMKSGTMTQDTPMNGRFSQKIHRHDTSAKAPPMTGPETLPIAQQPPIMPALGKVSNNLLRKYT